MDSIDWDVFGDFFLEYLGNVLSLVLNGIVVGKEFLMRNLHCGNDIFVFYQSSLVRNILDPTFSFDDLLLSDRLSNNGSLSDTLSHHGLLNVLRLGIGLLSKTSGAIGLLSKVLVYKALVR